MSHPRLAGGDFPLTGLQMTCHEAPAKKEDIYIEAGLLLCERRKFSISIPLHEGDIDDDAGIPKATTVLNDQIIAGKVAIGDTQV